MIVGGAITLRVKFWSVKPTAFGLALTVSLMGSLWNTSDWSIVEGGIQARVGYRYAFELSRFWFGIGAEVGPGFFIQSNSMAGVTQLVAVAPRQHHEVPGQQTDCVRLALHFQPGCARGEQAEGGARAGGLNEPGSGFAFTQRPPPVPSSPRGHPAAPAARGRGA